LYSVSKIEEVFKDPTLIGPIVERLAHRAHIMDMSREKVIGWKIQWSGQRIYELYIKRLSPMGKDNLANFSVDIYIKFVKITKGA